MSWITQGFVIAASICTIGASVAVVYALIKGRKAIDEGRIMIEERLTELDKKAKDKKVKLDSLVEAAASLITE